VAKNITTVPSPSDHLASKGRPSSVSPSIAGAGTPTAIGEADTLAATETIPTASVSPLKKGVDTWTEEYQT
jgi:hypothetical protein